MNPAIITTITSIIIFTLMIFFHEFGHFIAAKRAGITVEEFSIGMGPKLVSWGSNETEYSLRVFPIGGYVKMLGEDDKVKGEGSFNSKSLGRRIGVILAGPMMNILLAIISLSIIFCIIGTPTTIIDTVIKDHPAEEAGLRPKDKIIYIDGEKIESWDRLQNIIAASKTEQMNVLVERGDEVLSIVVFPIVNVDTGQKMIGITPQSRKNPLGSIYLAVMKSIEVIGAMVGYLGQLVAGRAAPDEIMGAVGIIQLVNQATKTGIIDVLSLTAFLSLNLGVINLLPIPALDGGRLAFLVLEGIRGKPVDLEKEGLIHLIGFVFLLMLIILITWKDITRPGLF